MSGKKAALNFIAGAFLMVQLFYTVAFACSGNCVECHQNLKKTIDAPFHKPIQKCIICHKEDKSKQNACGQDCFACHDKNTVMNGRIAEHGAIKTCEKCHNKEENRFFLPQLQMEPLRKFLEKNQEGQAQ